MDIGTPIGNIPTAPASIGNADVILWVVGVLFGIGALAVYLLYRTFTARHVECKESSDKCKESNEKAWAKVEEKDKKILQLHESLIAEAAKREMEGQQIIGKATEAFHELKDVVRDAYSGKFTAIGKDGRDGRDGRSFGG